MMGFDLSATQLKALSQRKKTKRKEKKPKKEKLRCNGARIANEIAARYF
jgi:hypothetical protein